MKTEDWDESWREKVNGLDTPPPQTQWNRALSWKKLETQLAIRPEREKKRIAWWSYAAAALLVLIPAFLTIDHVNRQRNEIANLKAELTRVNTGQRESTSNGKPLADVAMKKGEVHVAEHPIRPAASSNTRKKGAKTQRRTNATRPITTQQLADIPLAEPIFPTKNGKEESVLVDTAGKATAMGNHSVTIAKVIRKAAKAPTGRTVVFIFPGKRQENPGTQLAEATRVPRKFIFLSGEKEANPSPKPEDSSSPFLFTAKLKTTP